MKTSKLPDLNPNVEEYLMACLGMEVNNYICNVQGTKCLLCPFRTFSELRYLRKHLEYHCAKNMYVADLRSPQRFVVRAFFDYCQAVISIGNEETETHNLLKYTASIMEE